MPINFPFPTNAGPKPLIQVGYSGATTTTSTSGNAYGATAGLLGAVNVVSINQFAASSGSADEGQYAYSVFKFVDPNNTANLAQLLDSASLSVSFDGIASNDWNAGTFKYALINSSGAIGSWAAVNASATASSGTITLSDQNALDPATGTNVYGLVLAVQTVTDSLVESGEFVKFKVTQNTASGTAFTQSNYTESNVVVNDKALDTSFIDVNTTPNNAIAVAVIQANLNVSGQTFTLANSPVTGTAFADTFNVGGTNAYASSNWGTTTYFNQINSFGSNDKLSIDFSGTVAPGLSLVNFGNISPSVTNEAFLVSGLRALNGESMNQGGIYMMQVANASVTPGVATSVGLGYSTYLFVDTNNNGTVDTAVTAGDLLIRLTGVAVNTLQSTNFELVA